jgi:hypothetical protein
MKIFKFIFFALILTFLAVLINIEVNRLKLENSIILNKIKTLEEEKSYLEDFLSENLPLQKLEKCAKDIGLNYPNEILRVKIEKDKVLEFKREKYLIKK